MRMQVESACIDRDKVIHIYGELVDDLRTCRDERGRTDRIKIREFAFNTRNKEHLKYVYNLFHRQAVCKPCKTWGEAVQAIVGTTVNVHHQYLTFERI